MTIRTKRGALRRYNAIVRWCYRELKGGTQYGIDMPTLACTFPKEHAELVSLKAQYKQLPP